MIKYKCLSYNKDYLNKLDEELKKNSRLHLSFLTMMSINLYFVVKKSCLSLWIYGWLGKV